MFRSLTPVVRALLLANVAAYVLQLLLGERLFMPYELWPPQSWLYGGYPFRPWQVLTYGFLHSPDNVMHLFANMLALYMFGPDCERLLNSQRFLTYYLLCVIGAGLTQLAVVTYLVPSPYPTVGASGGIFGLLLLFGASYPQRRVMLLFPPIPMPAWVFVTLYGVLELVLGVTGTQQGVAHFAHLGGMAVGLVLFFLWRLPRARR
ncbi:MAG: rhomboid family intramembrane serine protease [Steroidobacteraceae bacterium]